MGWAGGFWHVCVCGRAVQVLMSAWKQLHRVDPGGKQARAATAHDAPFTFTNVCAFAAKLDYHGNPATPGQLAFQQLRNIHMPLPRCSTISSWT